MIYRIRGIKTLDFGSKQAALQLLDNYPPLMRESIHFQDMSASELKTMIAELSIEIQKYLPRDPESMGSIHYQWLLSRLEFYQAALPEAETVEAAIANKVANLPSVES